VKETATTLSVDRLHRLRPSDIEAIKRQAASKDELAKVVTVFASYLLGLRNPAAVEIDDVFRISLQLKMANVWEFVRPVDFAETFRGRFDPKIIQALQSVLDINLKEGSSPKGTSAAVMETVRNTLAPKEPKSLVRSAHRPVPRGQLTKSELIKRIAATTEVPKNEVKSVMDTLADVGHRELKTRGVFLVPGFAKFVVVKKPATKARKGANPFTGEEMMFKAKPARKIVRAKPVKATKDAV
jgi:DNA-binding protein HU-beta